ncbi:hypothetical protein [Streptomyces sp. MMBL 11-3]|uniref:hypothetical protein n=1 Tax=Streptomyces sp. MMBL 11-3 TaxID=3382639 RepID=UPI0039B58038
MDLVEKLAAAMRTMERQLLEHSLYSLGATHDLGAGHLIEPFLHHSDSQGRKEAQITAADITQQS